MLKKVGQTHYKMISCNIWLPVVIHRSKTRNNALDVFWGIETIIMPLSRQPQKKSFCPVSHSLAPTFMKIFFIMRLPYNCRNYGNKYEKKNLRCVPACAVCINTNERFCLHMLRVLALIENKIMEIHFCQNSITMMFKTRCVPA